jgi:hypothetical protein
VTYLLDFNMLIAAIWRDHQDQPNVETWLRHKQTATCPISELGFLRISSTRHFHFEPNRRLAETLFRNLFGNTAAGLFQTIFHPKESPRSRADNLPICILPNWLKNIE